MAENNQHFNIQELAEKWAQGKLTPEEKAYLEQWYAKFDDEEIRLTDSRHTDSETLRKAILSRVDKRIDEHESPIRQLFPWKRIAAAASVLLFVSIGGYYLFHKQPVQQTAQNQNDIAPGSNKAILKLANGKQISITDAKNGLIAQQGNTTITKTADGKLTYTNQGQSSGVMLYDTLIVPRGGQHQVKFSDGSVMMVNSDSKLRIPENFLGSDRTVELITGEADFKVVLDKVKPFRVKVNGIITQDIGTEFNINAYPEEAKVRTTLLEGSIRVTKNNISKIIKPGQQATVNNGSNAIAVEDADTDEAFAWINGKFFFNDETLASIMRQVSRWYDVDVFYDDESLKEKRFGGVTARFANVSQLLNTLELTNKVKFTVQGRKILVHHK